MNNISMIVNLGEHAVEVNTNNSLLIASHPGASSDPITECVQLSSDEAYRLYVTLAGVYADREQLTRAREDWKRYCALDALQQPWIDQMYCTGCGTKHLVAHLNDSGLCDRCRRS